MKWLSVLLISAAVLPVALGCGGAPTQADMRLHALHRAKDDDEETDSDQKSVVAQEPSQAVQQLPTNDGNDSGSKKPADTRDAVLAAADQPDPDSHAKSEPDDNAVADSPRDTPLTETECRQRSIDNMRAIGQALCEHLNRTGVLPPPAVYSTSYRPLLSWRVALLPYLGHESLYNRFQLDEPWDSTKNRELLSEIPSVYQSPERFDNATNYLVPLGNGTAFPGRRGVTRRQVEDGLENTALVLEVDDRLAVPWTKPSDYELDLASPAKGLGELRSGILFVVWGDGTVGQVSDAISAADWIAMFTIDSGDMFYASKVSSEAVAVVESDAAGDEADGVDVAAPSTGRVADGSERSGSLPSIGPVSVDPKSTPDSAASAMTTQPSPTDGLTDPTQRFPVPVEQECRIALDILRDLYRVEYENATTAEAKQELAVGILDRADSMPAGSVDRYVALELCRKIASQAGDVDTALRAAEQTARDYEADHLALTAEALAGTVRLALEDDDNKTVLQKARDLCEQALAREDFSSAGQLIEAAIAAARRTQDPKRVAEVVAVKKRIELARTTYKQVLDAVGVLDATADDPHANLTVGAYYCFIRQRWDDGLPMLARGSNARLAAVAEVELRSPETCQQQVDLADRWWDLAESGGRFEQAMRSRAAHWYARTLPSLEAGIQRVKAEVRIQQAASADR
jgi:hypothetical protein